MNKARLILSLVVAIAATVVALRYRTLRQAEAEQTQLRQQVEQAAELRAVIAQKKKTAPDASTNAAISNTEHLELLRLRNEIGQLRRELAVESNQIARRVTSEVAKGGAASADATTQGVVTKEQMVAKLNRAREEAVGLIRFAADHDQWPVALGSADEFELVVTGKVSTIKLPSRVIALREKQPWQASNGKWARVYGFADGHMEVAYSATDDFTEWERRKMETVPPSSQ